MNSRKWMYAGAMSAAIGLFGSGALAQIGQQQQQQQQRPGQVSPINGEDFLKDLEGEWNVKVSIYDMNALMGARTGIGQQERPGIGQQERPGVGVGVGLQQFQTQFEQALIRHGVDREEAREEARDFVNEIRGEDFDLNELRDRLQDALEDAGVSEQVAQTEAQRLAPQLHRHMQAPGQRPGQQPGQVGIEREAQYRAEGTATRSWVLNETFLQEELTFTVENNGETNPNPQVGEGRINLLNGDDFEGMALLAFEPEQGDLCIVWADNTKSQLHYGMGRYDTAQQQMVFHTIDPDRIQLPGMPARPGITPAPRPTPGGPQDAPGQRPGQHDRPGQPGQHDRPGIGQQDRPGEHIGQDRLRLEQQGARIELRVIDDNEHVVRVYRSNPGGKAARVMEITYTRSNNNND